MPRMPRTPGTAAAQPSNKVPAARVTIAWNPALITRLLTLISSNPLYRQGLFPTGNARQRGKWSVARDVALELLVNEKLWIAEQTRRGLIERGEDGKWRGTARWTSSVTEPIAPKVYMLKHGFQKARQEYGLNPQWTRWEDVPMGIRPSLRRAFPYYFLLRDLMEPQQEHQPVLPDSPPPTTSGARAVSTKRRPGERREMGPRIRASSPSLPPKPIRQRLGKQREQPHNILATAPPDSNSSLARMSEACRRFPTPVSVESSSDAGVSDTESPSSHISESEQNQSETDADDSDTESSSDCSSVLFVCQRTMIPQTAENIGDTRDVSISASHLPEIPQERMPLHKRFRSTESAELNQQNDASVQGGTLKRRRRVSNPTDVDNLQPGLPTPDYVLNGTGTACGARVQSTEPESGDSSTRADVSKSSRTSPLLPVAPSAVVKPEWPAPSDLERYHPAATAEDQDTALQLGHLHKLLSEYEHKMKFARRPCLFGALVFIQWNIRYSTQTSAGYTWHRDIFDRVSHFATGAGATVCTSFSGFAIGPILSSRYLVRSVLNSEGDDIRDDAGNPVYRTSVLGFMREFDRLYQAYRRANTLPHLKRLTKSRVEWNLFVARHPRPRFQAMNEDEREMANSCNAAVMEEAYHRTRVRHFLAAYTDLLSEHPVRVLDGYRVYANLSSFTPWEHDTIRQTLEVAKFAGAIQGTVEEVFYEGSRNATRIQLRGVIPTYQRSGDVHRWRRPVVHEESVLEFLERLDRLLQRALRLEVVLEE